MSAKSGRSREEGQQGKPEPPQQNLAASEKLTEQRFRCAEAFIGQKRPIWLCVVGDQAFRVEPVQGIPVAAFLGPLRAGSNTEARRQPRRLF